MAPELSYEGRGARGVPCVLIHGYPLDRDLFRGQLDGLAGLGRIVAVDLPGFGATPALGDGQQPISMEAYADLVVEVATGLGFDRFVLGGVSMGGYVALAALRKHRGRLLGLALIDTRAEADTTDTVRGRVIDADRVLAEGGEFLVERMLPKVLAERTTAERPDLVARVAAMMRRAQPAGIAAALRGMAGRADTTAEAAKLTVPTTVIVGADDTLTPPDAARRLAAAIPGAQLAVIPGAGHLAPVEQPDAVNVALRALLRRAAA